MRLDKFLKVSRLIKRRELAKQIIDKIAIYFRYMNSTILSLTLYPKET